MVAEIEKMLEKVKGTKSEQARDLLIEIETKLDNLANMKVECLKKL